MYKVILKNSAIYGMLPQFPKVASFFVLPLITPFLTPEDYGIIGILEVYIGLISALHFLGLNVVISNAFFRHPHHYKIYWRQIYGFLTLWSVFYVLILGFLIFFSLPPEAAENRTKIILIKTLPQLFFAPGSLFMTIYYRLKQNAWPIASRSMIAGLIGVGVNYYTIAHLKLGYMGWIYSGLITSTISGFLFLTPLYFNLKLFPIFNFKWRLIQRAIKIGLPLIPHKYSSYLLNSSDRMVMERLGVSTPQIGLYSLAYTLGSYVNTVLGAINEAIAPNLTLCAKNNQWKDYERLVFAFQSIIFFGCFILAVWVSDWMPLLIRNEELLKQQKLFVIIVLSYATKPMYVGCNQVLFYFEKTNIFWKISTVAGIINVISNILLIPKFGIIAAAWTTFASLLFFGFAGFFYKHTKELNKAKLYPVFWFIVIVLSLFLALWGMNQLFYIKALLSITVLLIIFIFFKKKNGSKSFFKK